MELFENEFVLIQNKEHGESNDEDVDEREKKQMCICILNKNEIND
jgi:hypothetical protein